MMRRVPVFPLNGCEHFPVCGCVAACDDAAAQRSRGRLPRLVKLVIAGSVAGLLLVAALWSLVP